MNSFFSKISVFIAVILLSFAGGVIFSWQSSDILDTPETIEPDSVKIKTTTFNNFDENIENEFITKSSTVESIASSDSNVIKDFFKVVAKPVGEATAIFDIFIKNEQTGEEEFFIQLENIYEKHNHFAEFHNGNLYIIKQFGYNPQTRKFSEDYSRELWKYDQEGNGNKIFTNKSIDFRVSPKEKFIAINSNNTLRIVDMNTKKISFGAPLEMLLLENSSLDSSITLKKWSEDGRFFWGCISLGTGISHFFKIDTNDWEITKYEDSLSLTLGETSLNPNSGEILYSNTPWFFGADEAEEFKQSQQLVTLFLYNLSSEESEIIDTSKSESFNPRWINDNTIEYTKGGIRITKKIYE